MGRARGYASAPGRVCWLGGALAVVLWGAASSASAQSAERGPDDTLARLAAAVRARLVAAAEAHVTRLVPPVAIAIKWKPQKLGSLDLGAPIVAVAAADLDRDGKAELYLVTSREVIAVAIAGRLRVLGRVAFGGEPAVPASRDPVGTAVVDGDTMIAAMSAWASDLEVTWNGKVLTARPGPGGFLVCGDRLQLAPGRNHFREGPAALLGARCRRDLTDATGVPLAIRGELSAAGSLDVAVARCAADGAVCRPAASYQYKDVGVAFEIADVDRDGTPDLILSSASAPGDADAVRVIELGSPSGKPVFKKAFQSGVAGIAVGDGDGDGVAEVIAVARLAGATRVDVWRLD